MNSNPYAIFPKVMDLLVERFKDLSLEEKNTAATVITSTQELLGNGTLITLGKNFRCFSIYNRPPILRLYLSFNANAENYHNAEFGRSHMWLIYATEKIAYAENMEFK